MKELAVFIDTTSKEPAYQQIYSYIKNEIKLGRLTKGTSLPSSRALAAYLQFSRSTILMAYDQLAAEGYIETRPQKGYYVMELEESFGELTAAAGDEPHEQRQNRCDIIFSPDGIETAHFPYNEWRKIARQVIVPEESDIFNSGDRKGDIGLRKILATYLHDSRGVNASPDQIILGAGNESLLMLLNTLINKDSVFAMENPSYKKSYTILKGLGRQVAPVELDAYGISIDELEKSKADIAYVTPSHQYPTGIIMSIKRRLELIAWTARAEGRYIIEDDYDSEFRYKGKPVPSLQGNDTEGKVIYIGTFSKSISPALRISYMVLPKGLMKEYNGQKYCSNTVSRLDQRIVQQFIADGGYERHLNRMRTIYKNKHDIMLGELKKWSQVTITGDNAGAHMIVSVNNGMDENTLVNMAAEHGVKVYPMSDYYIDNTGKKNKPSIIIGYARLNAQQIIKGLGILKDIWRL